MATCRHGGMAAWRHMAAAVAVAVGTALPVGAVTCPWCATEWTQILNNVELVGINITQVQALRQQFQQLEIQIRNARRLAAEDRLAAVAAFGQLIEVIETSRGASIHAANVDERYRGEFGGYQRAASGDERTQAERYEAWSDTNHENIKAALKAAGLHAAQFTDEHATLRALQRQTMDAAGAMQVMQAGAQIAAMQVEESRKLRALMAAQVQMQGNVAAVETERQAAADAGLERLRKRGDTGILSREIGVDDLRRE